MSASKGLYPVQDTKPTRQSDLQKGPFAVVKTILDLFTVVQKRDPPAQKTQHARLITIGVSHFCEKGRWALDLAESDPDRQLYYTEDAHPPVLHSFFTVPASNNQHSGTPMVILDSNVAKADPELFVKSDAISRHFCPYLYPDDIKQQVMDLEDDLGDRLGATIRNYLYNILLTEEYFDLLINLGARGTSSAEHFLFSKMLRKGVAAGMRKLMQVNDKWANESKAHVLALFDELSQKLLANGGAYLMDKPGKSYGFTAADLTFAALAGPIIRPPELSNFGCTDEEMPPEALELCNTLRATHAGKHVMRMYSQHRFGNQAAPVSSAQRLVTIKTTNRDRFPWPELTILSGVIVAAIGIGVKVRSKL